MAPKNFPSDWYNTTAREFLTANDDRVLQYILHQMLKLATEAGIEPTWDNFRRTNEWKKLDLALNKENQFMLRNLWMRVYKDTQPQPIP
jgi:hypothetical protein